MRARISIILSAIAAALLVVCIFVYLTDDRTAPELMVPGASIVYREGDPQSVLLADVTAWDTRDGDLTENIRIYSVAVAENRWEAVVTYAVYDKAGNMTKETRTVEYRK